MSDFYAAGVAVSLGVPTEHGPLRGELVLQDGARGIVVIVAALDNAAAVAASEALLAAELREAGLSTLSVGLLARDEQGFADAGNKVPLLAKRLIDFLAVLKSRMQLGSLPAQPFGIFAADAAAPVAVRAAALRDHDIGALVCRGGLIDRAGMLYLRSLEAPLLMLVDADDAHAIACSRRALQEVRGEHTLRLIPAAEAFPAHAVGQWFASRLAAVASAA